ncbi:MAG: DUF6316 family protein [Pseudomonadota bacterium]
MRKDDKQLRHYYRSEDRLFKSNGAWFYETREQDCGPFTTREEALRDLERFVETHEYFTAHSERTDDDRSERASERSSELRLIDPSEY